MPKLAIYIPKKDMKDIEQWRTKVNFSQIFMSALRREIRDRLRILEASTEQIAKAADFYRRALAEDFSSLVDVGYELGSHDVLQCKLTTQAIRELLRFQDAENLESQDVEAISAAIGGAETLDELARSQGLEDRTDEMWREPLCRGYAHGVGDAWGRVCQQMCAGNA